MKTVKIVGIDLGTTNSTVSYKNDAGIVELIPNLEGDLKTPSIVSYNEGKPIVGKAAKPDLVLSPEHVVTHGKRQMSESDSDDKPIPILTDPSGAQITPVDFSAAIISYLKKSAEVHLGCEVDSLVVTVPAYFKEFARRNTIAAAVIAGFKEDNVKLLDEPVSAAIYYGLEKARNERIVVVDFGGGTLDISVIEINGTNIKAIITDGDSELGGSNYTEAMLNDMDAAGKRAGFDISADLATFYQNRDKAREAKEMLARRDSVTLIPQADGQRTSLSYTRQMLQESCKDFDERFLKCCKRVKAEVEKRGLKIDRVVLVGGSTRLPHVPLMVESVFAIEPSKDTDPDYVVAKGAAVWAQNKFGDPSKNIIVGSNQYLASEIKVQTVAAHAICVAAHRDKNDSNEYNCPIVPANSPLPHDFQERFSPLSPAQTSVDVKLIQGKEHELSKNSTLLRRINVPIKPSDQDGNRICINGKYTEQGILEITITDDLLGKPISDSFVHKAGLSDTEIEKKTNHLKDADK